MLLKLASRRSLLRPVLLRFSSSEGMEQKLERLEKDQPFFDRLLYFDPESMAQLPYLLQPMEPMISGIQHCLVQVHSYTALPYYVILPMLALTVRSTILPLLYVQMQRSLKLSQIIPVLRQVHGLYKHSPLPQRRSLLAKAVFSIVRQQRLKALRLFTYNLVHIPMIVTMVWTLRRLLTLPEVKETSCLWLTSLSCPDPLYILPFTTVGLFYYNQHRLITPQNKDTWVSKIRNGLQVFFICWLPFLANWPSGIQLYMFINALFSLGQSLMMAHPWFLQKVSPKVVLYNMMLQLSENQQNKAGAMIDSIATAQHSYRERALSEEQVLEQMKVVLKQFKQHSP